MLIARQNTGNNIGLLIRFTRQSKLSSKASLLAAGDASSPRLDTPRFGRNPDAVDPRPTSLCQFGRQLTLQHLNDVFSQHGKELEAVERAARGDVETLGGRVRRNNKIRGGSERVPFNIQSAGNTLGIWVRQGCLPANPVFRHLPIRTGRSIPEIPGLNNILLQRTRNFPLVVVECRGWRRKISAWHHFASVRENLRSPPLELSICSRGKTTDEWLAYG